MSSVLSRMTLPAALAIVMLLFLGIAGSSTVRVAHAIEGDVCEVYTNALSRTNFDGQGNTVLLVERNETYGVVFRIEDDEQLNLVAVTETDGENDAPMALAATTEDEDATEDDEDATDDEDVDATEDDEDATDEDATDEELEAVLNASALEEEDEASEDEEANILQLNVLDAFWSTWNLTGENTSVRIDSETGSGRIIAKAEVLGLEEQNREIPGTGMEDLLDVPDVGHTLINPGVGTQTLDTISPRFFNNADGHELDDIGDWLMEIGFEDFVGSAGDNPDVCGENVSTEELVDCTEGVVCESTQYHDDSWGFFAFECIEAGYFHIDILTPDDTEETGRTLKVFCGGQPETAEISASPMTVETHPVGESKGSSIVTVTVMDQFGDRLDGAEVIFSTNNCTFTNPNADNENDFGISPAGGGQTVTVHSDTDTKLDENFLTDNPLQHSAGTAEVSLDCAYGTPGTARVTAIVDRPGADIVLTEEIKVVGPTAVSGLTLTLTPTSLVCGESILAEATAVDETGAPVSDGTLIRFTTDTTSGVVGGTEGAQGRAATMDGKASVQIATDPGKPGTHTVIAYAVKGGGSNEIVAQTAQTYVCDGGSLSLPPPASGSGGMITPPNTGDAGLASRG